MKETKPKNKINHIIILKFSQTTIFFAVVEGFYIKEQISNTLETLMTCNLIKDFKMENNYLTFEF